MNKKKKKKKMISRKHEINNLKLPSLILRTYIIKKFSRSSRVNQNVAVGDLEESCCFQSSKFSSSLHKLNASVANDVNEASDT